MTVMMLTAIAAALLLAFANGANDNAKGVATLIGSGTMAMRPAIWFATGATLLGSAAAFVLAMELARRFSGKGLVDATLISSVAFPVCVGIAAGATVLIATVLSLPISTTHAMVGAIVGIGVSAGGLNLAAVAQLFLLPLLVSPAVALALAAAAYVLFRAVRRRAAIEQTKCLCIGRTATPVAVTDDGAVVVAATGVRLTVAETAQCQQRYVGTFWGVDAQRLLDAGHVLSAGALSFARGLNDTPKIAAVLLAAGLFTGGGMPAVAMLLTGVAIAVGGLLAARGVARTMSCRITDMNDGQAFTANLTAAALVIVASRFGLPVSTTHVTCGSLFGIGLVNGRARWGTIAKIALAWVTTLPVAAAIGWLAWRVLGL